jgi:hypothetical protein
MNEQIETPIKQPTLNGEVTTMEKIEEKKKDQSIRIVEKGSKGSNDYRVLEKLHG